MDGLEALELSKDSLTASGDIFEHTKKYKDIKRDLMQFKELKNQLPRWYELLSHDGMNSKMMVKNDIQYQLNKTKAGVKSNDSD